MTMTLGFRGIVRDDGEWRIKAGGGGSVGEEQVQSRVGSNPVEGRSNMDKVAIPAPSPHYPFNTGLVQGCWNEGLGGSQSRLLGTSQF